jgi:hypothetical protein
MNTSPLPHKLVVDQNPKKSAPAPMLTRFFVGLPAINLTAQLQLVPV